MADPAQPQQGLRATATGAELGLTWSKRAEWMHRRVDSVVFSDHKTVRVHASIDLSIPGTAPKAPCPPGQTCDVTGLGAAPVRVLPIALLGKHELSMSFDLLDESDRSLPRLRAEKSAELSVECLLALASAILTRAARLARRGVEPPPVELGEGLRNALTQLCSVSSALAAGPAWGQVVGSDWGMSLQDRWILLRDKEFVRWSKMLAESYFLCVLIEGQEGQHRVVKYSYEMRADTWLAPIRESASSRPTLATRLGWADWPFTIPAAVLNSTSYHCEVSNPHGVDVRLLEVRKLPEHKASYALRCPTEISPSRSQVTARGQHKDDVESCLVLVRLKLSTTGWLRSATVLSLAVTLVMWLNAARVDAFLPAKDSTGDPTPNSAVLMGTFLTAFGAAGIAVLIRADEHELTTVMLRWHRMVVAAVVGLAFLVVLALVLAQDETWLALAFIGAGIVTAVGFALLAVTVWGAPWWRRRRSRPEA
ncbi:hypothetical protein ABT095_17815 [Kitasatospora sp. NPDC002227]|uniref:hypothetical protein n=1 Tax=Kitasatospora sp. NPDC002227 TaxID=3154773 RepID=UPI0033269570